MNYLRERERGVVGGGCLDWIELVWFGLGVHVLKALLARSYSDSVLAPPCVLFKGLQTESERASERATERASKQAHRENKCWIRFAELDWRRLADT